MNTREHIHNVVSSSPGVELPFGDVLFGASLPHPVIRYAIGPLNIVDEVLNKVYFIQCQDNLHANTQIFSTNSTSVYAALCVYVQYIH